MANYYVNEALFDLTERVFVDKTIHALETKLPSGQTLAVFMHRRPIEGRKSLQELVGENVALNDMRLSGYKVLDEVEANVGGLPGILLRARWKLEGTTYHQRQAHVIVQGKLMIVAVSAPVDEEAACDEAFESILKTIAWRTT
jgi:hypothetical protein